MNKIARKGLALALGATMLFTTSFVSAEAVTDSKSDIVKSTVKIETQELKGVIKELSDEKMKVEDKDGKIYTVPVGIFANMDDFKALDLKTGTEVVVEGFAPPKFNENIKLNNIKPEDMKEKVKIIKKFNKGDVTVADGAYAGNVDGDIILEKVDEKTGNVIRISPKKLKKGIGALAIEPKWELPLISTAPDANVDIKMFKFEGPLDADGKSDKLIIAKGEAGKRLMIKKFPGAGANGVFVEASTKAGVKVELLNPKDDNIFLPNSISANGKTVKLDIKEKPIKIMMKKDEIAEPEK